MEVSSSSIDLYLATLPTMPDVLTATSLTRKVAASAAKPPIGTLRIGPGGAESPFDMAGASRA